MTLDQADGAVNISQAIDELELDTPRQIADFLHERGIRGQRGKQIDCPVARYLTRRTGKRVYVVGQKAVLVNTADMDVYEFPDMLGAFVRRFDDAWYPELIELVPDA